MASAAAKAKLDQPRQLHFFSAINATLAAHLSDIRGGTE